MQLKIPTETWIDSNDVLPPDNLRVVCSDGRDWWVDWVANDFWEGTKKQTSDRRFWKIPALPNLAIVDAVFAKAQ